MKKVMLLSMISVLYTPILYADFNTDAENYFSDPSNSISLPDPLLDAQENDNSDEDDDL